MNFDLEYPLRDFYSFFHSETDFDFRTAPSRTAFEKHTFL